MSNFIAMLAALVVRDSNKDNQNMVQITNGIIAMTIVNSLTKV